MISRKIKPKNCRHKFDHINNDAKYEWIEHAYHKADILKMDIKKHTQKSNCKQSICNILKSMI